MLWGWSISGYVLNGEGSAGVLERDNVLCRFSSSYLALQQWQSGVANMLFNSREPGTRHLPKMHPGTDSPPAPRSLHTPSSSINVPIGHGVQPPFNHGFMLFEWGSTSRVDAGALRSALRAYVVTDPACNAKTGRRVLCLQGGVMRRGGAGIV